MLTYERMRKYEGAWHLERWNLFPECVIFECKGEEELRQILQGLEKELFLNGDRIETRVIAVEKAEEEMLKEMSGAGRNLSMSKGVIRKGKLQVLEGPLQGREKLIRKVDRHKRIAFLTVEGVGDEVCLKAGLEITEKTA